jgi:hypothetical protein
VVRSRETGWRFDRVIYFDPLVSDHGKRSRRSVTSDLCHSLGHPIGIATSRMVSALLICSKHPFPFYLASLILKMARSAHAYVRGSTVKFYEWLEAQKRRTLPEGPAVWICGDCHAGNLGPVANAKGGERDSSRSATRDGGGKSGGAVIAMKCHGATGATHKVADFVGDLWRLRNCLAHHAEHEHEPVAERVTAALAFHRPISKPNMRLLSRWHSTTRPVSSADHDRLVCAARFLYF